MTNKIINQCLKCNNVYDHLPPCDECGEIFFKGVSEEDIRSADEPLTELFRKLGINKEDYLK